MLRSYPKAKRIKEIRNCFPSLAYSELVYLDNAASSQTVDTAIKAVSNYHYNYRANVHRGDFKISGIATDIYDKARTEVAELINCEDWEVAFTAGTTHSMNMLADWIPLETPIIITELEHHSNILPWMRQGRTALNGLLVIVPANDEGSIDIANWETACKSNPGAVASFLTQSNLTGVELPWTDMCRIAKENDCTTVVDACQSIGHKAIDLQLNNIDYMAFSGHKMYASTGTGVLFSRGGFNEKESYLGGGTVSHVDFDHYVCVAGPGRVEAGTQNISGVHAIGAAAKWIKEVTYKDIQECEAEFFNMLQEKGLFAIEEMKLIGNIAPRSVYTFTFDDLHPSDVAGLLDLKDVCVRTGHMCAYPASNKYSGGKGVLRISSAPYNDEHDCVTLVEGLWKAIKKLSKIK
tara:strand:+ start:4819 stop:6039 length:1221 start_codon:yes stop_codon:yes gene_type:complete